ncbi:MAG: tetratricopeptide repeat protein, partial [Pirellulaceae bacterium]
MAKGQQTVIITAGDSRYFEFLASCIESINAARPRSSYALAVMDVGCTAQQRGWLEAHVDVCCEPAWHFEFANRSELPGYLRGLLARPFLRDYFPGFETYVWIDADAWVQEWRAIELFCAGARMRRGLAVVPEIDRCSWRQYGGLPEYWQAVAGWYAAQFGPGVGDRLCSYPMLNAGVFGLDAAAPHWNEWRSAIARALQWRCGIMTDQLALNVIVYMQGLLEKTELLPATCNWTCHNGFPMWDEHQRRMVEPYLPRAPIGIVHLTTRDKSPIRPIRTTDNRQIPARVMFPAGPIGQPSAGLAPAQDAASGNLAAQCREAFERGVRFHQSGELVQARAELEQVLRINPRHEYALHLLGVERLQQGNPQEAIGLIDQAIAINAQVAAFHSNRCAALAAMRRHEEAVVACRRALQLEPNSIELRLQLSHVLTQAEHTAEAESLLRALVQQHPEHADAYKALGRILMRDAARFGEAATALRRSLECGPASASTWNELGYIYKNLGRSEESVEAFRAAVDLEPGHAGAFNNLSVALRSLGRLSEAAEASR